MPRHVDADAMGLHAAFSIWQSPGSSAGELCYQEIVVASSARAGVVGAVWRGTADISVCLRLSNLTLCVLSLLLFILGPPGLLPLVPLPERGGLTVTPNGRIDAPVQRCDSGVGTGQNAKQQEMNCNTWVRHMPSMALASSRTFMHVSLSLHAAS